MKKNIIDWLIIIYLILTGIGFFGEGFAFSFLIYFILGIISLILSYGLLKAKPKAIIGTIIFLIVEIIATSLVYLLPILLGRARYDLSGYFILNFINVLTIIFLYDKFRKKKGDYIPIHNINMIMGNQKRDKKKNNP